MTNYSFTLVSNFSIYYNFTSEMIKLPRQLFGDKFLNKKTSQIKKPRMPFRMMPRILFPVMPLKVIPFRMIPVWCVMTICKVGLVPFSFRLTHIHIPRWFDISHWLLNFLYLHTQVPVVFVYPTHRLTKVVIIRRVFSIGAIKKQIYYKIV